MTSIDLVIHNCWVVTLNDQFDCLKQAGIAVSKGEIVALGPDDQLQNLHARADRVIDGQGAILMPGLINSHCHAGDSLFRGLVEDLPLEAWLQTVWQAEGTILSADTTHLGAILGGAELALSGVTSFMDMFWYCEETVKAARKIGLRCATGGLFFDPPGMDKKTVESRLPDAEAFFQTYEDDPMVLCSAMPHGTYTVGPDNIQAAYQLAEKYDGLFCTHAAETAQEQQTIQERYQTSVIRHLQTLGALNPRTVLAHCVHLDDTEIDLLAQSGTHVSHNPMSNLKLASGIARIPDMLAAGINVTLGTDGAISGNDLDMWLAMRLAASLHKGVRQDAGAVTTQQALAMATRNGAKALGIFDQVGSLEIGKQADMILVDTQVIAAYPMFDPMTHLVFSTSRRDVRDVFVAGRQIVGQGQILHLNMADIYQQMQDLTPAILASIQKDP